jgi:hypothetical protein
VTAPWILGDDNSFLAWFVEAGFLGYMGVLVSISVASAINVQARLVGVEERARGSLERSRKALERSTYALIWSLFAATLIAVLKPLAGKGDIAASLFNCAALLTMLFSGLVLADIVGSAFSLGALEEKNDGEDAKD